MNYSIINTIIFALLVVLAYRHKYGLAENHQLMAQQARDRIAEQRELNWKKESQKESRYHFRLTQEMQLIRQEYEARRTIVSQKE